ncbi:hypothetical protein DMUE_5136 [Dictyocoela muelleri]|nr:hypothetical protein DMUE_5136 [Dictyocoela muelleri]
MSELYDGKIAFEKLCLLLSDGVPYAVKAARNLKIIFPKLKHVTCIAHMLHRVCKKISDISPKSNFISTKLKRILVKNHENQLIFNQATGLNLPKFPILTIFGTWLDFMLEICDNYDRYKIFLSDFDAMNEEYSLIKDAFEDIMFISELSDIKRNSFIINSLKELEKRDLSSVQQIDVLKDVENKLNVLILKEKFDLLIKKNPDLYFFFSLNEITTCEENKIFLHVPLTTIDVERSFSKMTSVLDDLRRGMSVETQEMLLSWVFFRKVP